MSEATFMEAQEAEAAEAAEAEAAEAEAAEAAEAEAEAAEAWGSAYSDDARRRRQRQILMARQAQLRRAPAPARPPVPQRRPAVTGPSTRQAVRAIQSDIRSLDLDTQTAMARLRRSLNESDGLAYRNAWAAEAGVAASQILDSFEDGLEPHDWARALIRGLPTLALAPWRKRKPGIEGILFDPRVLGGGLITGIFLVGHFRGESKGVSDVVINPVSEAQLEPDGADAGGKFTGYAVDKNGNEVKGVSITWSSSDPKLLQVQSDGTFSPQKKGPVLVIAIADGFTKRQQVTVS